MTQLSASSWVRTLLAPGLPSSVSIASVRLQRHLERPTTVYNYDGLNNLTMTRQGGLTAAGRPHHPLQLRRRRPARPGRRDATGAQFNYYYDAAGNIVRENWIRQKADGTSVTEGILYNRDLLGRVTRAGARQLERLRLGQGRQPEHRLQRLWRDLPARHQRPVAGAVRL